jgi:4-hydroxy-tetrahydrodipicolinate reductase
VTARAGSIPVVIIGASGRMGQSLLRLLPQFPELRLQAAVVGRESLSLGRDSGELAGTARSGVLASADLEGALQGAALALDFSAAAAAARQLALCAAAGVPLLLGTTGLGAEMPPLIAQAAKRIPLLVAANTSLGAAVLQDLVRRAAAALGAGFDLHIQDTHHRDKADAPSGTALALGEAAVEGRGRAYRVQYASVRGGDVVGEHQVEFLGQGERLCLSHAATDRSIFAQGALRAGLWLVRQKPGTHHMADIFEEK